MHAQTVPKRLRVINGTITTQSQTVAVHAGIVIQNAAVVGEPLHPSHHTQPQQEYGPRRK